MKKFATTDTAAIGAIKAFHKFKIRIPEIIAVIGFSNSVNYTIIQPMLTIVDQPGDRIGRTAVKFLIEEIENPKPDVTTKTIEIKPSLIVRDSSLTV